MVLDEVKPSSPAEVQAVRVLAQYLHSPSKRSVGGVGSIDCEREDERTPMVPCPPLLAPPREALLKEVESKLTSGVDAGNDMFILMAASVFYHEQNFDSALRCLNQSDSLEGWALLHWLNLFSFSILPHFLPLTFSLSLSLLSPPSPPIYTRRAAMRVQLYVAMHRVDLARYLSIKYSASYQQSLHM